MGTTTNERPEEAHLDNSLTLTTDHTNANHEKTLTKSDMAIAEKREDSIEDETSKAPVAAPPYSVFIGWERYSVVAMVAAASLFR